MRVVNVKEIISGKYSSKKIKGIMSFYAISAKIS